MKIRDIIKESLGSAQAKTWTPQQWSQWLDQQIAAGEITKNDWETAKFVIDRYLVNPASDKAKQEGFFPLDQQAREPFTDLYYDAPHSLSELGKAEKTANKTPNGPFKTSIVNAIATFKPLAQKLAQLKPLIVTVTHQRAANKAAAEKQKAAEKGSAEALVTALEANKDQYVAEARRRGMEYITGMKKRITDAGGLNSIAPEPDNVLRKQDRDAWDKANQRRAFFTYIDNTSEDAYADEQARAAADSYDAWVYKLVQKIGKPVVKADVTGDPWTRSRIRVQTTDNEHQTWDTRMILNRSKLGKMFNQFPTRRA